MAEIKAIETFYKGYKFRSRLEARWAVFFDDAEIEYEYEPEGFVLSDGTYYLHDFYLPWFDMYIEIKPSSIDEDEVSIAKKKLEQLYTGECFENGIVVALFLGDPLYAYEHNKMMIFSTECHGDSSGESWHCFHFCEGCWYGYRGYTKHFITINIFGEDGDCFYNSKYNNSCLENIAEITSCRQSFKDACKSARQARFEHGECGI